MPLKVRELPYTKPVHPPLSPESVHEMFNDIRRQLGLPVHDVDPAAWATAARAAGATPVEFE